MKQNIYILILLFATTAFGQVKDRRAELDIKGRVNEISISPDEKIWLTTAIGNTYYTNNIDSTWHYGKPLIEKKEDDFGIGNPHLDRISFFNNDTAILTGYISYTQEGLRKDGYYRTTDAGENWELLEYGGDSWIYTTDFGKSWITIKLPYKPSDRTYGIFMKNSKVGVASSDDNEIISTKDNWKTISHIETPLDQKKYQTDESQGYVDKRISKIIMWNNYLVVNQNGHIFYSAKGDINWKSFPVQVIDFEVDFDSNKLFAITDSLKVISFSTPSNFQSLTNDRLSNSYHTQQTRRFQNLE